MRKLWGARWKRNGALWILLVAMLIVSVVVFYTYFAYRRAATELVLERDQQLAVLSAARLQEELSNFAENLEALARTADMTSGDMAQQASVILRNAPRLAVFDGGVLLLDDHGIVRATEPNRVEIHGQDWSERSYFQAVFEKNQTFMSDAVQDGPDDSYVIVISIPILGEHEQFVGALAGMFKLGEQTLSAFYASIVRLRIGQTGSTYIIDGQGRILFDSATDRVGDFLRADRLSKIAAGTPMDAELMRDEAGNLIVAAHAPVPGTTWTLITEDDWAILTQSTRKYSTILLLSFVAALVMPPLSLAVMNWKRDSPLIGKWLPSSESELMRLIRQELHPKKYPMLPGWDLYMRLKPGRLGGRIFQDAAIMPDGRMMLTMGRVSEGNITGALTLASTRTMLRAAAYEMLSPREAFTRCNDLLCTESAKPKQVECFYMLLDPSSGSLEYGNSGGGQIYFCDESVRQDEHIPDPPMGLQTGARYETGNAVLSEGGCVVITIPKMFEARNRKGESFGETAIFKILGENHRSAQVLTEHILSAFGSFQAHDWEDGDELGILVLQRMYPENNQGGLNA